MLTNTMLGIIGAIGKKSIKTPLIQGTVIVGNQLSITPTYGVGVTYQWKRDGASISGETSSTYDLVPTDVGADITVTVTEGSLSATSSAVVPTFSASLFNDMLSQSGNLENAKIRLGYDGSDAAAWNSGNSYVLDQSARWPNSSSPAVFRAKEAVNGSEGVPPSLTDKWEPLFTLQMLQPDGLTPGKYFLTTLGFRLGTTQIGEKFARHQQFAYGSIAQQYFTYDNINWTYKELGTSTTSVAIPISHPTQVTITLTTTETFTVGQKVTLFNSESQYFTGTFVSFDGVNFVFDSVSNVGTGTVASWTLYDGRKGANITITPSASGGAYNPVNDGETVDFEYVGDALRLNILKSNTRKKWLVQYLSGPDSANPPADVEVDCYDASFLANQFVIPFVNENKGTLANKHRIRLTVNGFSAGNGTGGATIYGATSNTTNMSRDSIAYDAFTADYQSCSASSDANEYAFSFKLNGTGDPEQWDPSHNGNGVMTFDTIKAVIDGNEVSAPFTIFDHYTFKFVDFQEAQFIQEGQVFTTADTGKTNGYFNYNCKHIFTKYGLYYDIYHSGLKSEGVLTSVGYANMIFLRRTWFEQVKTQGGEYIVDPSIGATTNLTASQKENASYLFLPTIGSSPQQDHCIALLAIDPDETWRIGEPDTGTWKLQSIDSSNTKFYPTVMSNKVFALNESYRFRGIVLFANKGTLS